MEIILTSHFEKNLSITPEKTEESGKILEKDLWVRAHSKEITAEKDFSRDIAPVELNGLNKMTILKNNLNGLRMEL